MSRLSELRSRPRKHPAIDPDTGEILESQPRRYRLRDSVLAHGVSLISDDRPVAAAIAFGSEQTPDERFRLILEASEARVNARLRAAGLLPDDAYEDDLSDEEFIDEFSEDPDPRYLSPHEFVYDNELSRFVPRLLKTAKKTNKSSTERQTPPPAPTPAGGVVKGPVAGPNEPAEGPLSTPLPPAPTS